MRAPGDRRDEPGAVAYDQPISGVRGQTSPLVGRARELATLLDALAPGPTGLVAVVGPPGIGKTRLLAAAGERVVADGGLVLRGRAAEFEDDLPFSVWIDALDAHLGTFAERPAEALGGADVVDELSSILPALAARASGPARPPLLDERHRVHAAVRRLLEALGRQAPVAVVLDDLHWADDGSIDLLASLLRRPPAGLLGLVVALRSGQASPRLAAALDRAERDEGLVRIALDVLDAADCDRLLGDAVPPARRAALRADSGGNPFFLEQLARADQAGAAVPSGVSAAIGAELRGLSPSARRLLEGAAVVGDPFEAPLAAVAASLDDEAAGPALDELARHELVRVASDGRRLAMRHPLVRRAVYETAGAGWRLAAHGRIARELRRRGAGPALVGHHVARSAEPGDQEAVSILRDGAIAVLERAPAAAAEWLTVALQLLDAGRPTDAERLRIIEPLATALDASGASGAARDRLEEAIGLLDDEDDARRVALVVACVGVDRRLGHHDAAHRRLEETLRRLPLDGGGDRRGLLLELATDAFYRRDFDAMLAWAGRVREAAAADGDAPSGFAASAMLALAAALAGRTAEGQEHLARASAMFDALPDDAVARRLLGVQFLCVAGMYLERFAAMIEHADRGIRIARDRRRGGVLPILNISQSFALAMVGRLPEAGATIDSAVEAARIDGSSFSLAWVLLNAAQVALFAGDSQQAIASAEECFELLGAVDANIVSVQAGMLLAEALHELGNDERAADEAARVGGREGLELLHGYWRCYVLEVLCRVELARGRRDQARAAADAAVAHAERLDLRLARAWGDRAQAALLLEDRPDEAAAFARHAAAAADAVEAPVEAARARILAGRALGRRRRDEALGELERALADAERCGARGTREAALRELRRLGRRPARGAAATDGLASLSAREREVAELVADGRTNAQIAAVLYLSPKTVETHMRNVFAKLRVGSRLEVARRVDRERA